MRAPRLAAAVMAAAIPLTMSATPSMAASDCVTSADKDRLNVGLNKSKWHEIIGFNGRRVTGTDTSQFEWRSYDQCGTTRRLYVQFIWSGIPAPWHREVSNWDTV